MDDLQFKNQAVEGRSRSRRFIPAKRLAARQLIHFLVWTVLPLPFLACYFFFSPHITALDLILLTAMWTLTGCLGISIGYHRFYTHHSFEAHPVLQYLMGAAGSMAAQGPVTYWVTLHRCHHQHSDENEDPHSPHPQEESASVLRRLAAFLHGHMGWVVSHDVPMPLIYARDLRKNPIVNFFDRTYWFWPFLGIILPGLLMLFIDPSMRGFLRGCVFGGLLRILVGNQIIWAINSLGHTHGSHTFDTGDNSANNWLLALPAFGEGWHNNHHAFPWSARFGLRWWQFDFGWWVIRCFGLVGLASKVKYPTPVQIKSKATGDASLNR
jgi:stearoyl-CoA desaturase (delta-9 desaturase)